MGGTTVVQVLIALLCVMTVMIPTFAEESVCPADFMTAKTVAEGCPCNPAPEIPIGLCESGFVCAEPWAIKLIRSSSLHGSEVAHTAVKPPTRSLLMPTDLEGEDHLFVCQSCIQGQYCPEGSTLPPRGSPLIQLALDNLECPAGAYCPSPRELKPCPPGSFCAPGTVQPITCNITTLVDSYPLLEMPRKRTNVYESVYIKGTNYAGNQCPANSSTPTRPCEAGYYCPSPGEKFVCPEGSYCKSGSQNPKKCPHLTSCPEGSEKASLSWVGFLLLIGILGALWIMYMLTITILRINQKRVARTQAARERLWKLLNPLFASQQLSKSLSFRAFKAVRPKINLEFEDLGLTLNDGVPILSGITGKFCHSRVAAILGPSGAGKSTFLNVIMGKAATYGKITGKMRFNGRQMKAQQLRGIVGFVPQEDIVHEDLTVRENLVYSARLRLSAAKPQKEQVAIVEDVINVLQLRHIQNQVVGTAERRGISGGQRKRVNIGWELVSKPSILFMDEPTSGLDSTAAADILAALKRMASLGMNISTVIHQPRYSIFSMFDDVMLLCKGGKLAYLGPSTLALPYMESLGFILPDHENPADFAMDVLSGSVPRSGFPNFQPEELVPLWNGHGQAWVRAQELAGVAAEAAARAAASLPGPEAVDPQQLRMLEDAFDEADSDEDESIDRVGLRSMLQSLGVEPSKADIEVILAELAEPTTGLINKSEFLQYVRCGGRPPTVVGGNPSEDTTRRVDSLYRVYSIEQYSLGAALSELAATQLPAGLKDGPKSGSGLSLKDIAAAVVSNSENETFNENVNHEVSKTPAPKRRTITMTIMANTPPVIPEDEDGERQDSLSESESTSRLSRTVSSSSIISMELPTSGEDKNEKKDSFQTEEEIQACEEESDSERPEVSIGKTINGTKTDHKTLGKATSYGSFTSTMTANGIKLMEGSNMSRTFSNGGSSRRFHRFKKTRKLRQTPGIFIQFLVLSSRAGIKWARNWSVKLMDLMLLILAAVACGAMHGTGSQPSDIRGNTALVMLTLGIISASTSLSVFGRDRLVHWRERDSGISVFSYFMANSIWNMIDVAIYPLVFLSIYQSMTLPAMPFSTFYIVGFLAVWWTTSAGCLVSILIRNTSNALVAAVAVVMIFGGFINGVSPNYRDLGDFTKALTTLSYNRWAVEAVVIASYKNFDEYMQPLTKALMNLAGYCGLDSSGITPISTNARGVNPGEETPAWEDPFENMDSGAATGVQPTPYQLEEQDITVYCSGYYEKALIIMFVEGLILRLATLLALYVCPRGLSLEPLVMVLGKAMKKIRNIIPRKHKVQRKATNAAALGTKT